MIPKCYRKVTEKSIGVSVLSFYYRCVQLWEPEKETLFTKSGESWEVLLNQLRNLLLESFGRHLDSFEDQIRVLREKYADPEWPFFKYFIVHVRIVFCQTENLLSTS